ncbi:MAG: Glutamate 5-kinase [Verrucomicrobia bacterium ADurb.Bin474]|nr:MAG: Glutamate 5-kinase [Verrucomicrobia bacterium ADurb.Bin474]
MGQRTPAHPVVKNLVVKLGTGILTSGIGKLSPEIIQGICAQIKQLRDRGTNVTIVSSGAVGLGMGRLGYQRRPTDLPTLQACAAVGQSILIETWQKAFEPHGLNVGQMLLTRDDLNVKRRHIAVRDTLLRLAQENVIPIINENDCISVDELKFGDNDVLSALVASLIKADLLVILSTIEGLLDLKHNLLIRVVENINQDVLGLAEGTTSPTAVGGMISKLEAARIATKSKCGMVIAKGSEPNILLRIFDGEAVGTFFVPQRTNLRSHKRWLAFFNKTCGTVTVDEGAQDALLGKGKSLLAKGIVSVSGTFGPGSIVSIKGSDKGDVARGLTGFSSIEIDQIKGMTSEEIRQIFPNRKHIEVVHRDSMVLIR